MFPHERYDEKLEIYLTIAEKHPVVEKVKIYNVALFMKDIYLKNEFSAYSNISHLYIRLNALKICLDTLRSRINKTMEFSELVSLTFTVAVFFGENNAYSNSEWRTHLKGSWHMLQSNNKINPKHYLNPIDQKCNDLYDVLRDWFCHAEILVYILLLMRVLY